MSAVPQSQVAALCRAAVGGRRTEVEELLRQAPGLARQSVHAAAALGDADALAELLTDDPARAVDGSGRTRRPSPLLLACLSRLDTPGVEAGDGVLSCARLLMKHGAEPGTWLPDEDLAGGRMTALGAAAAGGRLALCELLLDAGAEPNDGAALFLAVAGERWDCVELLRRRGADWNATDPTGRFAPLHWMLDVRFVRPAVDHLLAEGALPDLRVGELGESALHVAVKRRRVEMVEPLIQAGADVDARTTGGMTAYRHALRRGFPEVVEVLTASGADTRTTPGDELATSLLESDRERAHEILAETPDLLSSWTPEEARLLPDLAGRDDVEGVRLLLDAGLDIATRGLDGGTALHQVGWFGAPACAKLLLERGAPLAVTGDDHHSTPLGWVAHGSRYSGGAEQRTQVYADIAEMLLAAGAPFPGPDDDHDHFQLAQASEAVSAVLRRYGWSQS